MLDTTLTEQDPPRQAARPAPFPLVDVCVCSYRRPQIADTLGSIAAQLGVDLKRVQVIVADNDETPAAAERLRQLGADLELELIYVHAPARNISLARNACLAAATGEWIAFIDDDEIAAPIWLAELLAEAMGGGWDVVLGPVKAVYDAGAPAWMRAGDFHSTRPVWVNGEIQTGYSGNALIRRAFVEAAGLSFDLRFGRTGGEDLDFFYRLRDAGGRIGYADQAVTLEPVPAGRAALSWLLRRNFRAGQSHGSRLGATRGRAASVRGALVALVALAKAAACVGLATTRLMRPAERNRHLLRVALHWGVARRLMGVNEIELY
ncbi:MAG: glycosyl transferase, group 2 family protein [Caulobacter sp.]|nr:glycosyl transferase, group 2 family protein [Caulobacter sp.]